MEPLEQTRHTPESSWEDHADDLKTTLKNAFNEHPAIESQFFAHVDEMEYDDILEVFHSHLQEFIEEWKADSLSDALWELKQEGNSELTNQIKTHSLNCRYAPTKIK